MRIRVYENSAFLDEEAAFTLPDELTLDEALVHCQKMVDADLNERSSPGMSTAVLLAAYRMFGRDPIILGSKDLPFSAWNYAERRAAEMVATASKGSAAKQGSVLQ